MRIRYVPQDIGNCHRRESKSRSLPKTARLERNRNVRGEFRERISMKHTSDNAHIHFQRSIRLCFFFILHETSTPTMNNSSWNGHGNALSQLFVLRFMSSWVGNIIFARSLVKPGITRR
ncbi:PREDICTED: uncharacterized protein LOC105455756 [Wasmannia auropunctata]|uniref:uncharacterized protein LOC105455756 n=1 Tax=Wasmannia auropunctata TaxID=64793 RepID=UPI0005ED6B63|nr:PREDICTED: uncharacterized protein LOC105455756 [Wasmannia auropunctata]